MSDDLEGFLGGGPPGLKFPTKGTGYTMTLTEAPYIAQQVDFDTGDPLTWPDGKPRMQMVLTGTIPEDEWWEDYDEAFEGEVRCFVKSGLRVALREGLKKARCKVRDLDAGAVLEIKYVKDGPREGKKNPPKVYKITVLELPNKRAKDVEDFLGEDDENEEAPPRRRRSRDEDDEPAPKRRRPAEDDDTDDEDEEPAPRRRRTSIRDEVKAAKRNARAAARRAAEDDDDDDEEPPF